MKVPSISILGSSKAHLAIAIASKLFSTSVDNFVSSFDTCRFDDFLSPSGLISLELHGILLTKLFRPTMRKNCSSDQEKLLKAENFQHFLDKNNN